MVSGLPFSVSCGARSPISATGLPVSVIFSSKGPRPMMRNYYGYVWTNPSVSTTFLAFLAWSSKCTVSTMTACKVPYTTVVVNVFFLNLSSPGLTLPFNRIIMLTPCKMTPLL